MTTKQAPASQPVTIPHWDAIAREWRTVTVTAEPVKRTTRRRRAKQVPAVRMPLTSDGAPIESWWRDTAFAEMGPLADLRTHIKPAALRTHRPAGIVPGSDLGSSIAIKPSDRLDV